MPTNTRFTFAILLSGLALAAMAFGAGGAAAGIGAVAGVIGAALHFLATEWLWRRVVGASPRTPAVVVLYVAKMSLVFGFVWLSLTVLGGSGAGFAVGFSSLLAGILVETARRAADAGAGSSLDVHSFKEPGHV
jgi:hypothetical protein